MKNYEQYGVDAHFFYEAEDYILNGKLDEFTEIIHYFEQQSSAYQDRKIYNEALFYLEKTLAICQMEGSKVLELIIKLKNLSFEAALFSKANQNLEGVIFFYNKALFYLDNVYLFQGQIILIDIHYINILTELGDAYFNLKNFQQALIFYKASSNHYQILSNNNLDEYAVLLLNKLQKSYYQYGIDYGDIFSLEQSLIIKLGFHDGDHIDTNKYWRGLANIFHDNEKYYLSEFCAQKIVVVSTLATEGGTEEAALIEHVASQQSVARLRNHIVDEVVEDSSTGNIITEVAQELDQEATTIVFPQVLRSTKKKEYQDVKTEELERIKAVEVSIFDVEDITEAEKATTILPSPVLGSVQKKKRKKKKKSEANKPDQNAAVENRPTILSRVPVITSVSCKPLAQKPQNIIVLSPIDLVSFTIKETIEAWPKIEYLMSEILYVDQFIPKQLCYVFSNIFEGKFFAHFVVHFASSSMVMKSFIKLGMRRKTEVMLFINSISYALHTVASYQLIKWKQDQLEKIDKPDFITMCYTPVILHTSTDLFKAVLISNIVPDFSFGYVARATVPIDVVLELLHCYELLNNKSKELSFVSEVIRYSLDIYAVIKTSFVTITINQNLLPNLMNYDQTGILVGMLYVYEGYNVLNSLVIVDYFSKIALPIAEEYVGNIYNYCLGEENLVSM